jgi:predicted DNA-binding transcriptional regulator YafY
MTLIEKLNKIEYIDQLIRQKNTGTPHELAKKVNLSERQARRYLDEMKEMGAEISYNEYLLTYEYSKPIKFQFGFTHDEMKKITGGYSFDGQKMSVRDFIFVTCYK